MQNIDFKNIINNCASSFQGAVTNDRVRFNNSIGKGNIDGFKINDEIEVFRFDASLFKQHKFTRKKLNKLDYIPIVFGELYVNSKINDDRIADVISSQNNSYNKMGSFCTNSLEEITWEYLQDKNAKLLCIRIKRELFEKLVSKSSRLNKLLSLKGDINLFEELDPTMRELYTKIMEVDKGELFEKEIIESYSRNLVFHFFNNVSKREELSESNKYTFNVEPIFKAKSILNTILDRPVTIDYLTLECGISESRLRSLFKQIFGTTIHQYHQELRLNKSRSFLREGNKTMSMIAMDLGFSSASHFSMAFKKQFDLSPKEYKTDHIKQYA